ncbi:MAG: pyruvate formate lyase-activating protein [Lachnospiraceae bacterium]|nr:pyruvate formate lyase-activating protein [Lachnospiraceae bacterium]
MKGRIHSLQSFGTVDGPGVRYVVFLQGCPMRCAYCHNPDTWVIGAGEEMEASYIIEQYHRNEGFYTDGGITVTGGEPLLQIDFLLELFELAKKDNIHTCIDTSGITYKPGNKAYNDKLDKLMTMTDLVMLDIKHIDPIKHKELTDQPNDGILAFAEYLDEKNVPVWIRHVVVPGITDDDYYLDKLGYFIGGLKNLKALDVLPYHDLAKPKYENLGIDYKLKDVPPMDKQTAIEKKKVILAGIKRRRAEENIETDYKEHHTC